MTREAENLQDAIGLIKDEYIVEAHDVEAFVQAAAEGGAAASIEGDSPDIGEAANAKVIQMPAQRRRRRAAIPAAVAACLVIVLGVGALAITSTNEAPPATETVETEAYTSETREASASALMAAEAAGDGAAEGAGSTMGSHDMVPGTPGFTRPQGEALVLTAGTWNDNENWPFFTNLVNSGTIGFPSFGLDPTHRVKVTVTDEAGAAVRGQEVTLLDDAGNALWRGTTDKEGIAYLFFDDGAQPATVSAAGVAQELAFFGQTSSYGQQQGGAFIMEEVVYGIEDATLTINDADRAPAKAGGLQVMFIVDTTGSMSDEIAYLQKDFAAIAADAGNDGIEYSVSFYRDEGDEYVTKTNGFTSDVTAVQTLLNAEYADGGGDTPEAVADILAETITDNGAWRGDCNKLAFLVFDAPPHEGTDAVIRAAVESAAGQGIRLVPVVASNADRATELFGRALAIMTDGTYVFLTDDSGVGDTHLEPIIGDYSVELLHDVIVRIINDNR